MEKYLAKPGKMDHTAQLSLLDFSEIDVSGCLSFYLPTIIPLPVIDGVPLTGCDNECMDGQTNI